NLRSTRSLDRFDDRDTEQALLVPEGDRVSHTEVLGVGDVAVPGVVGVVLVVVPEVARVTTVVACGQEQPRLLRDAARHRPSLAHRRPLPDRSCGTTGGSSR